MPIFRHPLQHRGDAGDVGDAMGAVGGGVGGIELGGGEHPVLEALRQIRGVGAVGQVGGHQRGEVHAVRQRRQDALAVGHRIRSRRHRRLQVRHHDGAAELAGGEGQHRLQHGAVAQMDMPVVGTADDKTVVRHGKGPGAGVEGAVKDWTTFYRHRRRYSTEAAETEKFRAAFPGAGDGAGERV
ncbi:hypothetical protein [Azospirillum sp. INR13]|uniref:hypothetical protein n=1 Tax=Azospirillum sp. INR13 TaxID=2596919 RepID=UPI00351C9CF7